jgi:hypothetical protein
MSGDIGPASWSRLRHQVRDDAADVPTVPTGTDTGYGAVRYAIGHDGEPRLLVPCGPGSRLTPIRTRNLSVTMSRLSADGKPSLFVDVTCLDCGLESVFSELAADILRRVTAGTPPAAAVVDGIREFRALLEDGPETPVPDERIAGLLGELILLRMLCERDVSAIQSWTGPFGQRHDFRRGNNALEVKTSLRLDRTSVTVHGIDQLSAPDDGRLILFHIMLERDDLGALSIGALASNLISLGVDRHLLRVALQALDCDGPESQEWNRCRFSSPVMKAYEVRHGFPAITRHHFSEGVPPGLANVRYEVNLDLAAGFALDEASVNDAIARFLS